MSAEDQARKIAQAIDALVRSHVKIAMLEGQPGKEREVEMRDEVLRQEQEDLVILLKNFRFAD